MFFKKKSSIDYIIVGLGNYGLKYENTRHNMGFICIDRLANELFAKFNKHKFKSIICEANYKNKKLLLIKPQTYMNNSGEALVEAMRFYKLQPEDVIIIFDDISLPLGTLRLRRTGSDGGQKGMRSIIELSGSSDFKRIKVGIGEKPHPDYELTDWVLSKFTKKEEKTVKETAEAAAKATICIITEGIDNAMNKYNT